MEEFNEITKKLKKIKLKIQFCRYRNMSVNIIPDNILIIYLIINNKDLKYNEFIDIINDIGLQTDINDHQFIEYQKHNQIKSLDELMNKLIHSGYPIVDPETGRAKIQDKICKHPGCMKLFKKQDDLVKHLEENDCYKPWFHSTHETVCQYSMSENKINFTPEYVKENNITVCPAMFCKEKFDTCDELIIHFTILGIYPFWQPGMKIDEKSYQNKKNQKLSMKIISSDECVICYSSKPDILLLPCNHMRLCNDCYKIYNKIKCPDCRSVILDSIQIKN